MEFQALLMSVVSLFALTNASPIHSQHQHRSTNDLGQVYAYGADLSGVPLFVNDAVMYVSNLSQSDNSSTFVSFAQDNETHLIATPVSTDASVDWTASYLAINTTAGAHGSVILTNASDSAALTTTGFLLYGSQMAWLSPAGILKTSWYTMPTDAKDVWSLNWMADGNPYDIDGAEVIVLRTK
ncbi:hypothetical protein DOTSEDRAFT_52766 [Dothistroma septosporum NZE10]|uniref:Uncharacterized protein n=1 Tax=Dothistroma septosporum (strain NZE10 / CBS 128990) TaxID=675120 RepID=N1PT15_DOTSN|nr:hypothetical protein DOTSEDRAFT_52766 [Dothistroma septosporum NZE10]